MISAVAVNLSSVAVISNAFRLRQARRPEADEPMKLSRRDFRLRFAAVLAAPELNVLLFGFLLNYPWEFIQTPMYEGLAEKPHWQAVKVCTQAAVGDGVIMLLAFWGVALLRRDRAWIAVPTLQGVSIFCLIGVAITVCIEALALRGWWVSNWTYSTAMPIVPGLNVGLFPVLQWLLLPPLAAGLVGRQLRGGST